ncbi:MAG: Unknown protein [uncultured Aureispira sp.]|uniref:Uncharacterized protein n=1 Tax=uncultured Aureispira sp. TaxID=1331704 RepID=A0A6S6TN99_9BACT|nr:MAG: Unknown protein [uncultured Aureispira sp.]
MKHLLILLCSLLFLTISKQAYAQDDIHYGAEETFQYWAGAAPWEGIEVLNGQYWSSAHWSKEYILYMEVNVPVKMALDFIKDNRLKITADEVKFPEDAPDWFQPLSSFKEYEAGSQGSKYFINTATGHMFIYEVQL